MGADLILIDEAAHIDPKLFYKTIVPILQISKTSLLCLSSPEQEGNYYSALMELKDDKGKPFFNVKYIMKICADCLKLERHEGVKCNHMPNKSFWIDKDKQKKLGALYAASPEDAMRELKGTVVSDNLPAFYKTDIIRCFKQSRHTFTGIPPHAIFTAVDPSGMGPSFFSMLSGCYNKKGDFIILGMDNELLKHPREASMLIARHYHELKKRFNSWMGATQLWFIPENNYGNEGFNLELMASQIEGVQTYQENDKRPGIWKTKQSTNDGFMLLNHLLMGDGLLFEDRFFTVSREQTPDSMKASFMDELLRFHWLKKKPNSDMDVERVKLTGKIGNKQDDLVVVAMHAIKYGRDMLSNVSQWATKK